MTPFLGLLLWIVLGIWGYWIVLKAYKKLTGEVNVARCLQQSIVIILGPIAILFGLMCLLDCYMDNPKAKEKSGWLNKRIW